MQYNFSKSKGRFLNIQTDVADCIVKTIGIKADIYRIGGDEFVCIAERDISSYISELRDLISFEGKEKMYPLSI